MSELRALADLFRRYLHEDWAIDGDTTWDVVDEFIRDEPQLAERLPAEVDEVLSHQPTEEQLRHLVNRQLICSYLPTAEGWTYRAWLLAIAARVPRPLADRRAVAMSNFAGVRELAGYFHEDWVDDYSGPWDVVDDFMDDRPELVAGLPDEVDGILRQYPSEEQLEQFLRGLHFCYYVKAGGWTYRGWLLAVADRMRQSKAG